MSLCSCAMLYMRIWTLEVCNWGSLFMHKEPQYHTWYILRVHIEFMFTGKMCPGINIFAPERLAPASEEAGDCANSLVHQSVSTY